MAVTNRKTAPTGELTAFQRDLLVVIGRLESENGRPPKGLAAKRELETKYDTEINHGRLYPNLDDLVAMGLVDKGERDKRTNWYGLTDDGEATLEELAAWADSAT